MTGKRPITSTEFFKLHSYMKRTRQYRNLVMISLCYFTGYRIKEILSIKVSDTYLADGTIRSEINVKPRNMKKRTPRMPIPVSDQLREDLEQYRIVLKNQGVFAPDLFLIRSQKGANKPISYTQAYRIIQDAFDHAGIYENVALHSFRKSFCDRVYKKSEYDIRLTQTMMGHKNINTTIRYLSVDVNQAKAIIKSL